MYFYEAFNLTISSELLLPKLLPATDQEIDVVIRRVKLDFCSETDSSFEDRLKMTSQGAVLTWGQIGTFWVRNGREILVDPRPDVAAPLVRLPLLGVVLATLLHQRGYLVLHGSAMALDGQAVAFLGGKGWGKSTLAATLYTRGHHFISDDIVVVTIEKNKSTRILPAFPHLKLWPDTIAALGKDPNTMPHLASGVDKRDCRITDRCIRQPLPLKALYILDMGYSIEIEPLVAPQALPKLLGNSYMARYGKQLLRAGGANHFLQCSELIKRIPVYQLNRPQDLSLMGRLVDSLERHQTTL